MVLIQLPQNYLAPDDIERDAGINIEKRSKALWEQVVCKTCKAFSDHASVTQQYINCRNA